MINFDLKEKIKKSMRVCWRECVWPPHNRSFARSYM